MNKEELKKLISEMSEKAEKERRKREYIVILAFTLVFFLLFYILDVKPNKLGDIIQMLVASFMLSALYCAINHGVFGYLYEKEDEQVLVNIYKKDNKNE